MARWPDHPITRWPDHPMARSPDGSIARRPDRIGPVPRPLVYAHRGGAALRPENTIAAFDHGLSCGADGLEFDVHLSRDGVVVVHHDDTLDRTTGVTGRLADRTADELSR